MPDIRGTAAADFSAACYRIRDAAQQAFDEIDALAFAAARDAEDANAGLPRQGDGWRYYYPSAAQIAQEAEAEDAEARADLLRQIADRVEAIIGYADEVGWHYDPRRPALEAAAAAARRIA